MELEDSRSEYNKLGLNVCAISRDTQEILSDFAGRKNITYPLLADTDFALIRAFGILNVDIPADNKNYGIPYPGQYTVGPDRVVREKVFFEKNQNRISQKSVLIGRYGWIPDTPAGRVETDAFVAEFRPSETLVRPGKVITLVVDIKLKDKMHLYTPGVEGGYIPVSWSLEQSPRYEGLEVIWPKGEKIEFPALGETLSAYTGSFRFTQEVEIGGYGQLRTGPDKNAPLIDKLVIEGTFGYQACDDTKCYIPSEVKLRFELEVEGHKE